MTTPIKLVLAGLALAIVYGVAVIYSVGARSQEAKPTLPTLSADYQRGWCAGWKAASDSVIGRRNLWRSNLEAINPIDKWPEPVRNTVTAIDAFILIAPITGKVELTDKSEIDCSAK